MTSINNYLQDKISGWYSNARIDYGITGKFISAAADGNDLVIIHEEEGQRYSTKVCWYADYTPAQIYNIWMEVDWEAA